MRTAASSWNIPSNYGPHGELFFFLIKKEPTFYGKVVDFGRNASSDTEDGESFSGEDEEHNAENFMLCSFAFCVQSDPAGFPVRRGDVQGGSDKSLFRWTCCSSVRTERPCALGFSESNRLDRSAFNEFF